VTHFLTPSRIILSTILFCNTFHLGFPSKILYAFLIFPKRAIMSRTDVNL
jgi:hypothetical protein